MFKFLKPKPAEVLNHWYALIPDFDTSTRDFYQTVEEELKAKKVPGLEISRAEFAEGGLLSGKREYLRMNRERLVFDVCAAPFGTSYFFSCRFAEIPAVIKIWQWVLFLIALNIFAELFLRAAGFFYGSIAFVCLSCVVIYVMRNAIALNLRDLDAQFIKSPFVGPIYERFFRKETYYRHDTRLMYLEVVNGIVKSMVEDITAAKGIKLVRFNENSPILRELYKPSIVTHLASDQAQAA